MLVITRRDGEWINFYVGGKILLRLSPSQDGHGGTRICIDAPEFVKIMRSEIAPGAEPVTVEQIAAAKARAQLARENQPFLGD